MKKILLLPVLFAVFISSCIKRDAANSTTVTTSYPTITLSGTYFSVTLNSSYPTVTASVTDSFYNPCTWVTIDSSIHTNVAGLYVGTVAAKNNEGFISYANFYVAVTNISDSLNLAGLWSPAAGPLVNDSGEAVITLLANGLYQTSNIGDANTYTAASTVTPALFAVTNTTTIVFCAPTTSSYNTPGVLSMIPGDTTISYTTSTGATITYKKQ